MFDPAAEPRWMRRCTALALRLGFLPSLVGMSLLLVLGVLGLTQTALWATGQGPKPLALAVAGAMALLLSPFIAAWLLRLMFQLDAARQRHSVNATKDDLTGAHNRRHFMQVAEREWARCRRYAEDGAVLVIDADQFKTLKGSHGAACCDALLRDLTRLVTQSLRQPDLLARFGAEALIVYLPNTDPMGALDVAERIRERIAGHTLRWQHSGVSSTVSIGVASVGAAHLTLDTLVQDALVALQAAKDAGHNCVRAAPIQPRATPARPPSAASGGPRARRP
ncbi:MAG: GGDEF domain-containing protein [Rubrivivax sp.]|nr:GGDEF domain-containing protein [Rubrivivax sp.]